MEPADHVKTFGYVSKQILNGSHTELIDQVTISVMWAWVLERLGEQESARIEVWGIGAFWVTRGKECFYISDVESDRGPEVLANFLVAIYPGNNATFVGVGTPTQAVCIPQSELEGEVGICIRVPSSEEIEAAK